MGCSIYEEQYYHKSHVQLRPCNSKGRKKENNYTGRISVQTSISEISRKARNTEERGLSVCTTWHLASQYPVANSVDNLSDFGIE